jgi:uncharacterized protein (TIGR02284 family)
MQKINKVISAKLCKLLAFLHHATEEFESVSKKIKDKNIKMSVREVALETNQYKSELDSHLTSLRIKRMDDTDVINGEKKNLINNNSTIDIATDKEIMTECCKTEIYFEKAYRNVLNEYFPDDGLRNMLTYQLNGIKCAFMQLKLLRTVGFNSLS